jgi:hypothetical protein
LVFRNIKEIGNRFFDIFPVAKINPLYLLLALFLSD